MFFTPSLGLSVCLCVCLSVCHHVCGEMAALSNMASSEVNTSIYKNLNCNTSQDDPFPFPFNMDHRYKIPFWPVTSKLMDDLHQILPVCNLLETYRTYRTLYRDHLYQLSLNFKQYILIDSTLIIKTSFAYNFVNDISKIM